MTPLGAVIFGCASMTFQQGQARDIANNASQYPTGVVVCAIGTLQGPKQPLPQYPTDRYVLENPSRYSMDRVMAAHLRVTK